MFISETDLLMLAASLGLFSFGLNVLQHYIIVRLKVMLARECDRVVAQSAQINEIMEFYYAKPPGVNPSQRRES